MKDQTGGMENNFGNPFNPGQTSSVYYQEAKHCTIFMGAIVEAIIEYKLTPAEIVALPEQLLVSPNNEVRGVFQWTCPLISIDFLKIFWLKSYEDFIGKPWSVEELALLEKDNLSLLFSNSNLVCFDSYLPWSVYKHNLNAKEEFEEMTKEVFRICKGTDIIIVESGHEYSEYDTVEAIRKDMKSLGRPVIEIM